MGHKGLPYLHRVWTQIKDDLRSDSLLRYILLLALFVSAFWFWWRIPSFATADERGRLLYPMMTARYFLTEPLGEAIRHAAETGPGVGKDATFYLHGILISPVFIFIVATGRLGDFTSIGGVEARFAYWTAIPEWFWTSILVITRLGNVLLAVGIVYMTYRIGTFLADRRAGQISSTFTALSLAVFQSAHEANEDTAMVFLLLIVLYLSIKYVNGAEDWFFLAGCGLGGLAIAFKLTGGVAVVFLASAFLLRAIGDSNTLGELLRSRLLFLGFVFGAAMIYIGIPGLLIGGPEWLTQRITGTYSSKSAQVYPQGYTALLAYLNSLGLPLFAASVYAVIFNFKQLIYNRWRQRHELVLLVGLSVYFIVFFILWNDIKTHHVLPSIPILLILVGVAFSHLVNSRTRIARALLAVLLLTTAVYASIGVYQYTNDPRDQATEWLQTEVDADTEIMVSSDNPAAYGVDHGREVIYYPSNYQGTKTEWLLNTSDRQPPLIQISNADLSNADQHPRRSEYYEKLMKEENNYVMVAEFGERRTDLSRTERLLREGLVPRIEKRSTYVAIFAKNESLDDAEQ
jgi:hypothetical protein